VANKVVVLLAFTISYNSPSHLTFATSPDHFKRSFSAC